MLIKRMQKKKKKDSFNSFRTSDKNPYKTIKTTLKSVLKNTAIKPQIDFLVQEINDLVIHTYQFIRLYILFLYKKNLELPDINEHFIISVIKTLGIRDNRGGKNKDIELLKNFKSILYYRVSTTFKSSKNKFKK